MRRTSKILVLAGVCLAFALAAVFLAFGSGLTPGSSEIGPTQSTTSPSERPNIIFVLADDMRADELEYMPKTQELLVEGGASFENTFVTNALCCPSRASILLGQYTHNHQVLSNEPPDGGSKKFRKEGHEDSTVATWLQTADYQTALIGRYLNGYGADDPTRVPPGWDEWYALLSEDKIPYYGYRLNENGTIVSYDSSAEDYQTDVLARKAADYVRRAANDDRPFFMHLSPRAPHDPYTPAARHEEEFADAKVPRTPSFDEEDVSDKPSWVRGLSPLDSEELSQVDEAYRDRLRLMLAVDEMISGLVGALEDSGELENTYIVFSSDNGFHLGEHRLRLRPDKRTAYEEDIRVPLIVRGPGVPAGRVVDRFALNIDLAPTFAEWGGAIAPDTVDGRSLVPLLTGDTPPATWRTGFLVEHYEDDKKIPAYGAVRTEGHKYVKYEGGERELYDLRTDPYELQNSRKDADPALEERLEQWLAALRECAGEICRAAEDGPS